MSHSRTLLALQPDRMELFYRLILQLTWLIVRVSVLSSILFCWGQLGQMTDRVPDRQTDREQQSETQTPQGFILGPWFTSIGHLIGVQTKASSTVSSDPAVGFQWPYKISCISPNSTCRLTHARMHKHIHLFMFIFLNHSKHHSVHTFACKSWACEGFFYLSVPLCVCVCLMSCMHDCRHCRLRLIFVMSTQV